MTNNTFTPEQIARMAAAIRTSRFDPTRGRAHGRAKSKKQNHR